eukprot:11045843-Alexandrium_andersonii.AAC.1
MATWALWRQADLATVLRDRVAALAFPEETATWCPCGAFRPQRLSMLRLGVAQFFKSANLQRGQEN